MKALGETTDLLARAALLAAGFHQHKRGEWRKRRGNRKCAGKTRSERSEGTNEVAGTRPGR
jgi:hypothetical protein